MTTSQNPSDSAASATASQAPRVHPERKRRVRTALTLFSVSAWITGVMLLALVVRMVLEYIFNVDMPGWATIIAIAHGWCYFAFILATLNLGLKARWSPTWWITTMLGGVVPFLSFFVESNRRKQVTERFQLNEPDAAPAAA